MLFLSVFRKKYFNKTFFQFENSQVAERKTEKGRKREAERSSLGIPNKFCVSRTSTRSIFCQRPLTKKV